VTSAVLPPEEEKERRRRRKIEATAAKYNGLLYWAAIVS